MNATTTVIVKSKLDGNIYKNTLVITHESAGLEPLLRPTASRSEIADKIADIDMSDEQGSLFGDNDE